MDLNTVNLIGRLTKDIEIRMTQSGKKCGSFTLACNRDKENADFISCVAWEKTAELIEKYCSKGSKICVTGRIQTRNYQDNSGRTVYVTEVICNSVQFLDTKKEETTQGNVSEDNNDFIRCTIDLQSDDLPF